MCIYNVYVQAWTRRKTSLWYYCTHMWLGTWILTHLDTNSRLTWKHILHQVQCMYISDDKGFFSFFVMSKSTQNSEIKTVTIQHWWEYILFHPIPSVHAVLCNFNSTHRSYLFRSITQGQRIKLLLIYYICIYFWQVLCIALLFYVNIKLWIMSLRLLPRLNRETS